MVSGDRPLTTVPTQALYLLNSEFLQKQAATLAQQAYAKAEPVIWLHEVILGRVPSATAAKRANDFINTASDDREKASPISPTCCSPPRSFCFSIDAMNAFPQISPPHRSLKTAACGFGSLALRSTASPRRRVCRVDCITRRRAKRVIFLFMHGGPSQVDTFDYKPKLQQMDGKKLPFAPAKNLDPSSTSQAKLLGSPWKFSQHGEAGLWGSDLFPEVSKRLDELCVIRSMQSKGQSHGQAVCMIHTGADNFVRPSMGSWISYGLGTENADLPAFVSISPSPTHGGPRNYGSAFLPAAHQGTTVGRAGKLGKDASFRFLDAGGDSAGQIRKLDLLQAMNREHFERTRHAPIEGMIQSMELAFRMQREAPGVMDIEHEPEHIKALYGIGNETPTTTVASACSRVALPKPACATSRSAHRTCGTSIRTSSPAIPRTQPPWIVPSPDCSPI
jgi:hypothetical protein